uniref:Uncharacterized protein n=1 Tax=Arundo donax TaxID=35708 RepID=A0A0A8Y3P5_ARUDO
MTHNNYQTQT